MKNMSDRSYSEIKWIKIATNIFSDEKILLIEQMPDADTLIVIWFKLLCLAGKENNCGVFVMGNKIPYTDEMLATIFRRPIATVRLALKTFEAFGMVDIINDPSGNNVYSIPNWDKHQNIDGMDKIREQTRKRVAKYRENQRKAIECNVTETLPVTQCNGIEKEEDKEKDKEKDKKKKESAPYVADSDLNDAICAFIEYRKKIRKPMTERAIQLMIGKLNQLSSDIATQIEILNQSIMNGWQGIFPLNEQKERKQENVPDWLKKKNSYNSFMQRDYDFESLENELIGCSNKYPNFAEQKEAGEKRIKDICCR